MHASVVWEFIVCSAILLIVLLVSVLLFFGKLSSLLPLIDLTSRRECYSSNWGATNVETWTPAAALHSCGLTESDEQAKQSHDRDVDPFGDVPPTKCKSPGVIGKNTVGSLCNTSADCCMGPCNPTDIAKSPAGTCDSGGPSNAVAALCVSDVLSLQEQWFALLLLLLVVVVVWWCGGGRGGDFCC